MSLVNQMLKDLEQRRADRSPTDSLQGLHASTAHGQHVSRKWWIGGTALLLFAATAIGWSIRPGTPNVSFTTATPVDEARLAAAAEINLPVEIATPEALPATPVASEPLEPSHGAEPGWVATEEALIDVEMEVDHESELPMTTLGISEESYSPVGTSDLQPAASIKSPRLLTAREQADQQYSDALNAVQRGDISSAERDLLAVLGNWPEHRRAAETLAVLFIQQARLREATELLHKTLALDPRQPTLAKLYARLLADQQRDAEALSVLQQAADLAGRDAEFLALQAALLQREQQHQLAADSYRRALTLDARQGAWWMGLGISLEHLRDTQQALAAYRQALSDARLDPRVSTYLRGRITTLQTTKG